MVGYGTNKGIIPVSSEEIFTRIHANENENLTYEVTVSMLEIYNEKV
jgi:kinesin family protein 1